MRPVMELVPQMVFDCVLPTAQLDAKVDILVVDDNPKNVLAVVAMLESLDQNVVAAASGIDALRHLLERDFALTLMDVNMPGLDGFETAQIIRSRERSRHMPIIFLTALSQDDALLAHGYELGAVDFLFKPIVPLFLRSKVKAFVDLHRQTLEIKRQAVMLRDGEHRERERALAETVQRIEAERIVAQMLKERADAVVLASTVADRERAEVAAQVSHRRLRVLSEVAVRLLGDDDPSKVLRGLLEQLATHLQLEVFLHHRVEVHTETLVLEASGGLDPSRPEAEPEPISRVVAATRQRWIAEHVRSSDDAIPATVRDAGLDAYACFPLVAQGRLLGTLAFGTRLRPAFDDDEVSVMEVVCDQVAVALERARMIAELFLRNAELAHADRRKDEFLAMLAHELRNPMAPIVNAVQVLRLPGASAAAAERALDALDRQSRHMVRLIDDLLDLSRIQTGKITLRSERVTLASIVSHAIQASALLMAQHEHVLSSMIPDDDITLFADVTRLGQVIANLLENAAKYSPKASRIALTAERDGDEVVLRVRDSGVGIEPALLSEVFELFVQSARTADRTQGGLGIGLTVVKYLVELHGGSVRAQSDGLGLGSEFSIRLPIAGELESATPTPAEPPPMVVTTRRVVVIEDNEDIGATMKDMLEVWGHEATLACDGPGGVEMVLALAPDIAFIDIGLPGLDGYQVAAALRKAAPDLATRLVALTGYGSPEDRQRAFAAGFDDHVVKPVTSDELRTLIEASPRAVPQPRG